ncbi:tRNA threonylcarbamoyladenosine biosynthesis protein RimN [Halorhodospira abdelmalekii]|uniref:L-threonylcarbamoyladenylate synthase n=1 Tax=Halorhodospira abdelmalekii TaxID=421629 RepID=UPI00190659E1|nr:Sua5/YciO/YrdC/YwlC family protein [Halorhodospira abdelmalekii]MBK1734388.1 tRNA threonylcarbamoyladenosine biosynthesis protein RimN [Halorhodospira abdelmalekii]
MGIPTSTAETGRRFRLHFAARALRQGGVIAYPTEAVWGLGCNPWSQQAVSSLLALKGRSATQGLIVIAATLADLTPFMPPLPAATIEPAQRTWPGPVTWIVPAAPTVPEWLTGGRATVAVRVTAHPQAAALCRAFGGAIVSTSANPTRCRPARSASQVRCYFGERIAALLPGPLGGLERPTPIYDLSTGRQLRA